MPMPRFISQLCALVLVCLLTTGLLPRAIHGLQTVSGDDARDHSPVNAIVQLVAVGPAANEHTRACTATGFLIDEEGYLITNAHVVDEENKCLEAVPSGKILAKLTVHDARTAQAAPCDIVGIDAANDLALLKVTRPLVQPGDNQPYAKLDAHAVDTKTPIIVSGYPGLAWQPVTQMGKVLWTGKTSLEERNASPTAIGSDALILDILLQKGNSGSPVYRLGGGVIAVVDEKYSLRPDYSVAVAVHYAIELAERYGAHWHAAE
jgi:serine protease Do